MLVSFSQKARMLRGKFNEMKFELKRDTGKSAVKKS